MHLWLRARHELLYSWKQKNKSNRFSDKMCNTYQYSYMHEQISSANASRLKSLVQWRMEMSKAIGTLHHLGNKERQGTLLTSIHSAGDFLWYFCNFLLWIVQILQVTQKLLTNNDAYRWSASRVSRLKSTYRLRWVCDIQRFHTPNYERSHR